mmetsp:Transcript_93913/g.195923  ORF Transcript_93913/g.195923 Transcript_93913/m.195923 type:complete len:206 (+) Transcript_93913:201-818(+)
METRMDFKPNVLKTFSEWPCSLTIGAPPEEPTTSMLSRGALGPSQRFWESGAEAEMALRMASLAAHRPAKFAAGSFPCRQSSCSALVKLRSMKLSFSSRGWKVETGSTSTPTPVPAVASTLLESFMVASKRSCAEVLGFAWLLVAGTDRSSGMLAGAADLAEENSQVFASLLKLALADGLRYTASSNASLYGGWDLTCTKPCLPE